MLNRTRTLAAATALASALTLGASAEAGTLQLRDGADLLTPDQASALRSEAARYDFDVRVLTDSRFTTRAEFERHVASQLASPTMVAIGIDPTHRWTAVHFGTGTRIASSRFATIENAGDAYFRSARWGEGLAAVLGAAQSSVSVASDGRVTEGARPVGFPWSLVFVGLFAMGGIALVARALNRRRDAQGYAQGYSPTEAYPMGGAAWGASRDPRYGYGPGYGPAYGPSAGGGIGTGIAGAAIGGLAGYALGSAMANRDEHPTTHAGFGGADDAPDAGGSASGWDDGGDVGGDGGGGGDW